MFSFLQLDREHVIIISSNILRILKRKLIFIYIYIDVNDLIDILDLRKSDNYNKINGTIDQ